MNLNTFFGEIKNVNKLPKIPWNAFSNALPKSCLQYGVAFLLF